jgi:hypothetical protein
MGNSNSGNKFGRPGGDKENGRHKQGKYNVFCQIDEKLYQMYKKIYFGNVPKGRIMLMNSLLLEEAIKTYIEESCKSAF